MSNAMGGRGLREAHTPRVIACAVALLVGTAALASPVQADTHTSLTPASGPGGTAATILGSGFGKQTRVIVAAGPTRLARAHTDKHGAFAVSLRVPARRKSVKITSRTARRRVVNVFTVSDRPGDRAMGEVASRSGARLRWTADTDAQTLVRASGVFAVAKAMFDAPFFG